VRNGVGVELVEGRRAAALPGVEGRAGFLKTPALEDALGGGVLEFSSLRCFRGDTNGLWTPESRRRLLATESAMMYVVEVR